MFRIFNNFSSTFQHTNFLLNILLACTSEYVETEHNIDMNATYSFNHESSWLYRSIDVVGGNLIFLHAVVAYVKYNAYLSSLRNIDINAKHNKQYSKSTNSFHPFDIYSTVVRANDCTNILL